MLQVIALRAWGRLKVTNASDSSSRTSSSSRPSLLTQITPHGVWSKSADCLAVDDVQGGGTRRGAGVSSWPSRAAEHHDARLRQALDRRAIVSEGGQHLGRVLS